MLGLPHGERGLAKGAALVLVPVLLSGAVVTGVASKTLSDASDDVKMRAREVTRKALESFNERVQVIVRTGRVSDGEIGSVSLLVRPQMESTYVNFENIVIQYISDSTTTIFHFGEACSSRGELDLDSLKRSFGVVKLTGSKEECSYLRNGSLAEIWINLKEVDDLKAGEKATLHIISKNGIETQTSLIVPSFIESRKFVEL